MTAPPPLPLRCRDFARHEHLCIDLGIPPGAFRHHDWDDLREPCLCATPWPSYDGWDAEARAEWNLRCHDRTVLDGDGWHAVLCCRCVDASEADDATLAEVARRVAEAMRETGQPVPATTAEALCFALARSIDLVRRGTPISEVNRTGRMLRREAR